MVIKDKEFMRKWVRENKDNIMLVTPEEHRLLDQGTEEQRKKYEIENSCSFDRFFEKKDALRKFIISRFYDVWT